MSPLLCTDEEISLHYRLSTGSLQYLPHGNAEQPDPVASSSRLGTSDGQPAAADGAAGGRMAKRRKVDRQRADAEASAAAMPSAADVLSVFRGLTQQSDRCGCAVCSATQTCRAKEARTSHGICCAPIPAHPPCSVGQSVTGACATGTTKAAVPLEQTPRRSWRLRCRSTLPLAPGAGQPPCLCGMGSWHAGGRFPASGWRRPTSSSRSPTCWQADNDSGVVVCIECSAACADKTAAGKVYMKRPCPIKGSPPCEQTERRAVRPSADPKPDGHRGQHTQFAPVHVKSHRAGSTDLRSGRRCDSTPDFGIAIWPSILAFGYLGVPWLCYGQWSRSRTSQMLR